MLNFRVVAPLVLMVAGSFATGAASAGELSAIINGKSWHAGANQDWNENNYGLGVEYAFDSESPWHWKLLANGFVDSVDNMSYMAGGGLHRRVWETGRFHDLHVDLGVNAFLMTREDVNEGRPFPGLLPGLAIENRYIGLNLTYLPRKAVELMYDSPDVDSGISGIFFIQLKLNADLLSF